MPDIVNQLITTQRELIELARRARKRRPVLTEYRFIRPLRVSSTAKYIFASTSIDN
jgi:hypothetical protein